MRILTYGLASNLLAGIETFLLNMNRFMSEEIVFDYVIENDHTIHQAAIDEKGGKCFFISPKRKMLRNLRDWCRVLKQNKGTAAAVYFNMYSLAWSVPILLARLYGYRVVVHAHNNNLHNCGALLRMLHKCNKQLLKLMKITRLTNSTLSTEFFFGSKEAEMICCAIETPRFAFREQARTQIREELAIGDGHLYGFAGRIAYQKNPLFLIDVFAEIRKIDQKAQFVVCGEGDMMEEVKERAQKHRLDVHFVGSVPNVQDYYQAMDLFLLPSRFEGLGIVLIEAQTSGLPSVTSADVVPKEAKVTELLEYVSLEESAEHWARRCVDKLLNAPKHREQYAAIVGATAFDIRNEAPRLGQILCGEKTCEK